ncbi:alpha/beta hydrolase family protein [Saccharopolyspora mangrovi]|uniref:Alpha/beta hydrolase n=1 Tax=Saccharopolyspora mangrovi TaxID=3082379 RepID=A0ABU6A840_9PSEU|nr:alpha/beta hydrolase [Saccharopolyspora sp. S2-29]MEB3367737.1 alpha/beta hydrolase [Saccharopolyspora sp. S2-29]
MELSRSTRPLSRFRRLLAVSTAVFGLLAGSVTLAQAAETADVHGPDPTEESITAPRGPFEVDEESVSRYSVQGFGGGTIYYPTDTADGLFSAVSISPGYTGSQDSIAWLGPRLASQGFVVFTIDTITTSDQPDSRARQLQASLDYLTDDSSVKVRIDPARLGVMGHSMGGGGSLKASLDNPALKAAIPMTPWDTTKDFSGVRTPTLIIGAQDDTVAPVAQHAKPFYESLPDDPGKAYLELAGASHFAPNTDNTTIAKSSIAWLKRFLDDDTRYDQFLCPPPQDAEISDYQSTCPY